jgi:hypothetical protein
MANMNKVYAARLSVADRKLKEAKARLKLALMQQRGNQALEELRELVPVLNGDSERLADSLTEAKRLMQQCEPGTVRGAEGWQADNLPLLLETGDGGVVMRRRGV